MSSSREPLPHQLEAKESDMNRPLVSAMTLGFLLAVGAATSLADRPSRQNTTNRASEGAAAAAAQSMSNWTFEGCWTRYQGGACSDVYRDGSGNFWLCKACGTTKNPGPSKCRQIGQAELNSGFWCS